jgi:uncharacterized protein
MRYFDASALAKRYLEEEGSPVLRALLEAPACTSRLTEVEVASALLRRTREGSLESKERDRLLADLGRDLDEILLVELTPAIAGAARQLLVRHALCASDAIHLESCLSLRFELDADIPFVAFDARLQEAARAEGLLVEP